MEDGRWGYGTGRTLCWLFAVHWERPGTGAARVEEETEAVVTFGSCYSRSTAGDGRGVGGCS